MKKRILVALGFASVLLLGLVQFATVAKADHPVNSCIGIFCVQCPDGYVHSPSPGNCCRCVKAH